MCGIAGILSLNGKSPERRVVESMGQAIAHRGPDGSDLYVEGPVALAHRRLAIIDLSSLAAQPMHSEGRRYTIVYNGELYNFRELRAELQAAGRTFHSRSDTEVVLHAWAAWGKQALSRFNGMFAFALWDASKRELWLARDRYGIKPLYWTKAGGSLVFGSEVKALLRHPQVRREVDHEGLMEYLSFQNFFGERTLFAGIQILAPGTAMLASAAGSMSRSRFWDWNFCEPTTEASESEYAEELDRLFEVAVKRQLVSDVPVGAYLSGGMDSGSITAVAARELGRMHSFTVGFDMRSASGLELSTDERGAAEYMSYLFGTEHYEVVLKAGDMVRAMPRLAFHMEEPRVGQSYPNFYASQLASRFNKTVLSGAGGDEIFGGYPWRYYRAVVNTGFDDYIGKYFSFWQRLVPDSLFEGLISPIRSAIGDASPYEIFRAVFPAGAQAPSRPEDYVNLSLYFEAKTFLHGLLVMEDKLSMAHGLEVRVPFLDNDLVDFAMKVPVRHKLGNLGEVVRLNENQPGPKTEHYFQQTRDGKLLLRKTMERHVPREIVGAVKRGFSGPDASWFRGESVDHVRATLIEGEPRLYEFIDGRVARQLINDHLESRENRRLLIWSLLSLENWFRIFMDGEQVGSSFTEVSARVA